MTQPTTVHRDELDGVPVFWVDTGRPTLTARLHFRTGVADETLPTSGLTHVAQHLVLAGLPPRTDREVGGSTDLLHTTLRAQGVEAGVRRFLIDACEWLDTPDLGRVVKEGQALRSELAGTEPSGLALLRRYGARGPGLAGFHEPALSQASPDAVRFVIHTRFTRGNAALVLDGPPPVGFRLPLRDGPRQPLPHLPVSEDPRPAAYLTDDTMTVSGEVPSAPAAMLLAELLRRALHTPATSQPWATAEPVGPGSLVVVAGFRVAPAHLGQVVERTYAAVEALRRTGPGADVLAAVAAAAVGRLHGPLGAVLLADAAARDHLDGIAPAEPRARLDALTRVTAGDVQQVVEEFAASLLLGVPAAATWTEDLPILARPTRSDRPKGRSYRSRNVPLERRRLVVGPESVQLGGRSGWQGMRYDEVAAMFAHPDGGRELVATDGWPLVVEPTLWVDGQRLVADLDEAVAPDLVVPAGERRSFEIPRPAEVGEGWSAGRRPWTALAVAVTVGAVLLAAATGHRTVAVFATVVGLIAITLTATRRHGGRGA